MPIYQVASTTDRLLCLKFNPITSVQIADFHAKEVGVTHDSLKQEKSLKNNLLATQKEKGTDIEIEMEMDIDIDI